MTTTHRSRVPQEADDQDREGASTRLRAAALLRDALAGRPPLVGPRLVVLDGPERGNVLALREGSLLGRGRSADLPLPDPRASRRQARFEVDAAGAVSIHDVGSRHALRVNGRKLRGGKRALAPGDLVQAGATRLRFEDGVEWGEVPPLAVEEPREPSRGSARLAVAGVFAASAAALLILAAVL